MARRSCDAAGLLAAFRAAVANLEAHVDEVNALNVYPVPDGDTGSNMAATVRAALAETDMLPDKKPTVERLAAAISFGALMGARGNSGVILSQIFRGMAEGLGGKRRLNGPDLAHALSHGTKTAYAAVAKPVEGTILTVIREAADAAVMAVEHDGDLEAVLTAAVEGAEKAVARTPALLDVLREAGVVDAGGQGLYRVLQGALRYLVGEAPLLAVPLPIPRPSALVSRADEGFGYETMFLLTGRELLDTDAIRAHLESIGESVLVAGDARAVKVHVHNERPDAVLGYGLTLGTLSRISVENLDSLALELREARATEFTGLGPAAESRVTGVREAGTAVPQAAVGPSVVAVVAGDGLAAIFDSFGVERLPGGQGANPSAGDLLQICRRAREQQVLVLPNNPNVRLAAEQAADLCQEKRVVVVPTRNAAEGFAALLAFDPKADAEANRGLMLAAARAIQTLQVTDAVRDARVDGRSVKRGQTIVLDPDEGLVAADADRTRAVLRAVETLVPGYELLTLYYGAGADLEEAEELARRLTGTRPGVEVEVVRGGQPHYRYLISAE